MLLPTDPTSGAQQYPRFVLATASLKGNAIASASAVFDTTISQWAVSYNLRAVTPWDQVAQANFHQYVAIDLDGVVESAPLIQPGQATFTSFNGKGEISGNFTQQTAKNLALELNYGSLPVPLKILTQETVSPSLGKSSLKAGLAGRDRRASPGPDLHHPLLPRARDRGGRRPPHHRRLAVGDRLVLCRTRR